MRTVLLYLLFGSVYSEIIFVYCFLAIVVLTILLFFYSLLFWARVNETGNLIVLPSYAKFIWRETQWQNTCTVLVTICLQFSTHVTYLPHSS
jgi:hypothetical protein